MNPFYYTDKDAKNPRNRQSVEGMSSSLKSAGNLVGALADLYCAVGHPLFTPQAFLRAPINIFGASDPWSGGLDKASMIAFNDSEAADVYLAKTGLKASTDVMIYLSGIGILEPTSEKVAVAAVSSAMGLIQAFAHLPDLDDEINNFAKAAVVLRSNSKPSTAVFKFINERSIHEMTVAKATALAGDYKPSQEEVDAAQKSQREYAGKQLQQLPTRMDPPGVSDARLMKADFAREVADFIEALDLSKPNAFPEGVAVTLAALFRRRASVADGTFPGSDPITKNNEKTYMQTVDFLRAVEKGSKKIGKIGEALIAGYLPFVLINKRKELDLTFCELPSLLPIEEMAQNIPDVKNNKKVISRGKKNVGASKVA